MAIYCHVKTIYSHLSYLHKFQMIVISLQIATILISNVEMIESIVFHGCGYVMVSQNAMMAVMSLMTYANILGHVEATSQPNKIYLPHPHTQIVTHTVQTVSTPSHCLLVVLFFCSFPVLLQIHTYTI